MVRRDEYSQSPDPERSADRGSIEETGSAILLLVKPHAPRRFSAGRGFRSQLPRAMELALTQFERIGAMALTPTRPRPRQKTLD